MGEGVCIQGELTVWWPPGSDLDGLSQQNTQNVQVLYYVCFLGNLCHLGHTEKLASLPKIICDAFWIKLVRKQQSSSKHYANVPWVVSPL